MDYYNDLVYKQPHERSWVTFIKGKVLQENNSFPCMVVGKTGSGKSYSVLRLCQELVPDFQLDENWYFRADEFMQAFTSYYKDRDRSRPGKIWVLDEAGVDLNSLKYQNSINKAYSSLFQTSRFRNYVFFGTVPFLDFISKQVRKLMNFRMDAKGVENNKSIIIPRTLEWNEKKEDFYEKRLIAVYPDGEHKKISRMLLPLARKSLRIEYEKRRREFSDTVNSELVAESIIAKPEDFRKIPEQHERVIEYISKNLSYQQIAEAMNLSKTRISVIVTSLRQKGWDFNHNKDGNRIFNPVTKNWMLYPKNK